MTSRFETLKNLADIVFDRAMDKTGGMILLAKLDPVEKTVVLAFDVLGLAGGMGLEDMLDDEMDDDPGYVQTIEAYRKIGENEMADILNEGLKLKQLVKAGKKHSQLRDFKKLDTEFYAREQECIVKIGEFVEANSK